MTWGLPIPFAQGLALAILSPLGASSRQPAGCGVHLEAGATSLDTAIVAAMRRFYVPGVSLAVVRDGRTQVLAGYGCATIERAIAVDPVRTVFHVASVSKPFVALDVVQLATRGVVDLRTDVNRYLRGARVPPGWNRPVTLHDLLTHSAGFEERIVGYAARTPADVRPLGEFLTERLPRRGWATGDVTAYSNYGYALAAYVVESVTGVPFYEQVRGSVLEPLGMTRSSFLPLPSPELAPKLATSYRCAPTRCEPIPPEFRSAYPPGGLLTTAQDMARFMVAQLGDPLEGKRVLSDSVLRLMHTRQFTLDAALPGLTYGFAEDAVSGERALSHAGGASGYMSFVVLVPERRFGVFLVANGGQPGFGGEALQTIAAHFLPGQKQPASPPERLRARAATVDPVGAYRLTRYAHRGVENLPALFTGQLHVRRLAGDTIEIFGLGDASGAYVAVAPNRWRSVAGADLVAVRTRHGTVTHLFGSLSFFGTRFPAAFERLAWYDEPHFVNEALSYTVTLPLIGILVWPLVAGLVWIVRRQAPESGGLVPSRRLRYLAAAASVTCSGLAAWFAFGFIAPTSRAAEGGGGEIIFGLPPAMRLLAWAPSAIVVLAGVLIVAGVLAWRRRWWSLPSRLLFSAMTMNAVGFALLLVRWGYFPVATG